MKKQKNLITSSILAIFLFTCADPAISEEEISVCVCENRDNIILVENVAEEDYARIEKYENDLLCMLFASNRVDNRFKIDIAMCTRDENT